jgi:hypothetical protein
MEKEINETTSLDKLFDDFNKRTSEQFEDILSKIDTINSGLRKRRLSIKG